MDLDVMRLHSREEFQIWLAKEVEVREELEDMIGSEHHILDLDAHLPRTMPRYVIKTHSV